jgi:tellurite resistance protein TehA-like permease
MTGIHPRPGDEIDVVVTSAAPFGILVRTRAGVPGLVTGASAEVGAVVRVCVVDYDDAESQFRATLAGRLVPRGSPGAGGRILDDPAWFGAVMGTGAVATAMSMHPGRWSPAEDLLDGLAYVLFGLCVVALMVLSVRAFALGHAVRSFRVGMRSPVTGAGYATIPGAVNVIAVAMVHLWPDLIKAVAGWWTIAALAGTGTALGLWLTVEFFVSAFEHPGVDVRDISGVWFIPETVVLLGALLISGLARGAPASTAPGLSVVAFALLGAGAVLFAVTATMFVNRLVLHPHDMNRAAPSMWIMVSPLSVTSLALPSVAADTAVLGGRWTGAVLEMAAVLAAMLWGFALWWMAAACLITRHSGRAALTGTAADWAYVFPLAAMLIATLTLGRVWQSAMVEALGALFGLGLVVVWTVVAARSAASLAADRRARAAGS